jgi:MYXO-CTERM domain-containing protein
VQKTVTVADAWRGKPQITIPGFVGVQAVPEPNYSALAAMGGIGLIAAARRRRRKT